MIRIEYLLPNNKIYNNEQEQYVLSYKLIPLINKPEWKACPSNALDDEKNIKKMSDLHAVYQKFNNVESEKEELENKTQETLDYFLRVYKDVRRFPMWIVYNFAIIGVLHDIGYFSIFLMQKLFVNDNPKIGEYRYLVAIGLYIRAGYEEAVSHFSQLCILEPDNISYANSYLCALLAADDIAGAHDLVIKKASFKDSLRQHRDRVFNNKSTDNNYFKVFYNIGVFWLTIYEVLKRQDEKNANIDFLFFAAQAFKDAFAACILNQKDENQENKNMDLSLIYNALGVAHVMAGSFEQALIVLKRAIHHGEDFNEIVLQNYATFLLHQEIIQNGKLVIDSFDFEAMFMIKSKMEREEQFNQKDCCESVENNHSEVNL